MRFITLLGTLLLITVVSQTTAQPVTDAQGDVGIGTVAPHPSAILELRSTTKGLLIPRMTMAMRNTIVSPATGLVIFNTDSEEFEYNFGTQVSPEWTRLLTDNSVQTIAWLLQGNAGTTPFNGITGDFLGTTDDADVVIATGGSEQGRFFSPGNGGGFSLNGPFLLNGTAGNSGQVLTSQGAGSAPQWTSDLTLNNLTTTNNLVVGGNLTVSGTTLFNGTVNFSTTPVIPLAQGNLLVGNASNQATPLPPGTTGQVFQINGSGSPAWQTINILPTGGTPNAILVWNGSAWVENTNVTSDPSTGNTTINGNTSIGGSLSVTGPVTLPAGSIDNSELANSTVNVSYGTGLSGSSSVALGGTLNLQNTGVTSVTGTTNQVNVSGSTGAVTLSLPQNIDVNATPTFDAVILDNLSGGSTGTEVVVSNGGTLETRSVSSLIGASTLTQNSLWVGDASNNPTELAAGTTGQVFQINGSGSPAWQTINLLPTGGTPNAILVWNGSAWVENTNVTSNPSNGNTTIGGNTSIGGSLSVTGPVTFPAGSIDNSELANSMVNVSYGTGLSGSASVALGGTLSLQNTGVTGVTGGTGVGVSGSTGNVTITNTGVTSVTGTTNQVNVSGSTGSVTLSLPQDIDVNATPTFDAVILDNLSGGSTGTEVVVSNGGTLETRSVSSLIGASTLTENSLWVGDASNNPTELSAGTMGQVLRVDGTGSPAWQTINILPTGGTPNAILVWNGSAWVENTNVTSDPSTGNTGIGGSLTVTGGVTLPAGSIDNSELANSTVNVSYGTGLSGDASVALGGTLNLQNTGVTSVTGTTNQVNVSGSTGAVTLSLPQDIDVNATPTFDAVILDNLSGGSTGTEVVVSNGGTLETRSVSSLIGASTLTENSLWVGDASNNPTELSAGTTGQVLRIDGTGSPAWQTINLLPTGGTPNAILVWNGSAWVENTNVTSDPSTGNTTINGTTSIGGSLSVTGPVTLPAGSIDNSELANSTVNVSYGTGLSGDASVALGGTLNLQNTGVTSVTGTTNQVNVSGSTGSVTLSLPQDIDVNATPTFDAVILDNLSGGSTGTEVVISNGGTLETRSVSSLIGATTLTENSLWVGDASNNPTELAAGTTGQVLRIDGTGSPAWQTINLLPTGGTPNAILVWNGSAWVENTNVTSDPTTGNTTIGGNTSIGGSLSVTGPVTLPAGSIDNSELANSTVNVSYGIGLSGSASVSLGGTLSLQNTGVTSVTGTTNQVNVSGSTGSVTLSLPQDIDVNATPTFDAVILDNLTGGSTGTEVVISNGGTLETRSVSSLIGASTLTENNLWVGDASNNPTELAAGTTGQVLRINGTGSPAWQTVNILPIGSTPNSILVWNGSAWVENTNVTSDPSTGNTSIGGSLTVTGGVTLPAGSIDNSELANSAINVSYGTGLSGSASVSLGGTLNLQNTGVTSVTGTTNQVNVSGSTGAVTLSLPQNIDVNATPTFDAVILDNLSGGSTAANVVVSNGGTLETRTISSLIGAATLTQNNLWVGSGSNTPTELPPGGEGDVLTIVGGTPTWGPIALSSTDVASASTTDETFAVRGTASGGTSNQVAGVWGRATDPSAGNTGTIGVFATGNGNTTTGQTNAALQVNDGEIRMGRTTQTGTGYSVVEGAAGGTAYTQQGPSGVIEFNLTLANSSPLLNALVGVLNTLGTPLGAPTLGTALNNRLGTSVFNTTLTVNNRYASTQSIVLVQLLDIADTDVLTDLLTLFQNGTLIASTAVTNRQAGSFDLTVDLRALGPVPAISNATIKVGYVVINPSR